MVIPAMIVALALIFFGRSIYWVFVGGVGFMFGMEFAAQWLAEQPEWMILIVALAIGVVGALLAIFFQRIAIGIAGFLGGGHFALRLAADAFSADANNQAGLVAFLIGGIVAAIAVVLLLDWALIVLSALVGSAYVAEAASHDPLMRLLTFAALFVAGVAVQARMLRGRRMAEPVPL